MPVMNGLEAAPLLKRMLPAVPIILFTLHDNKTLEREALALGVSAVISKAASMKTLIDQARILLSGVSPIPNPTRAARPNVPRPRDDGPKLEQPWKGTASRARRKRSRRAPPTS